MKKIIYLTILVILLANLYIYTNRLNAQTGWFMQNSGTSVVLRGVSFINDQTGWAVGWSSSILKTTNGGISWSSQNSGTSQDFKSVQFINENTGWAVGGHQGNNINIIVNTTNGGQYWFTQYYSTSIGIAHDLFFINPNTGWVACSGNNGKVLKTINGGQNWMELNTGVNLNITNCYFLNQNIGWVVGDNGAIFKTTNGGNSWITQYSNTTQSLLGLYFLNSNTGHVTGHSGTYLKTTNGGLNWISKVSGALHRMSAICFADLNTGWMVGGTFPGGNTQILKTINGGDNWVSQTLPTTTWLDEIMFVNSNTGWSVGNQGTIIKTTNGGASIPSPPVLTYPPNNAINISVIPTLLWNTSQGATSYHVQISTVANFYVITDSATISSPQYQVTSGKLINGYTYFWRVNASNPAGTSGWSSIWSFSTGIYPPAPILISPPNGFIGTPTTPTLIWDSLLNINYYRIEISRIPNFLLIVDSATTVQSQYTVPTGLLFDNITYFWRVNASNSLGTGPWSEVWSFTPQPTGISPIAGKIPTSFNLFQNYPNPFNPLTNIKFDIPKSSYVKITVYDNLGKEVAKLVDKKLPAGSYEVDWNASNYASGIYFYRIETNEFSDVKKMILIK